MRADSAFYGHAVVGAAVKAGAEVSVTVRLDKKVKAAIAAISEDAWTTIAYPNAVFDEATGRWISRAEVAEIDFVAFTSKKKADQVPGRLVVRRIPDLAPKSDKSQATLFDAVAPSRVLHHHASRGRRHRRRRQDPPWPRDHRAGPRRPEGLRAGAPAVGEVQRQRRLAGARGDGVQPHPRRRRPGRT